MNKNFLQLILALIMILIPVNNQIISQVVFESSNEAIYDFLTRFDKKHIIDFPIEVKPQSKKFITRKLHELNSKQHLLNNLEVQELKWYLRKYSLESDSSGHILAELNLIENDFKARLLPIIGYRVSNINNVSGLKRKIGIRAEAYYGNVLGIMFEYVDYGEFWGNVDRSKQLTSETGHFFKPAPNGIEYSDVRGQLNLSWGWGVFSIKKDYNKWGYGRYGQLFLSSKPASYPHIEFQIHPTDWLDFYYVHGWLNSLVPDSANFYYSHASQIEPRLRKQFKSKYIAANYLSIRPLNWLNLAVGYSFIYSGDLRPETFIPFMYYNQNTGREAWDDGNGMLSLDLAIKFSKNYMFYGTLLMDDVEIRDILDGIWWTSWLGYTIGVSAVDFIKANFDITIEYTKTDLWLYEHKYDATTYKHLNYTLGHWIGQNSDLLTVELEYSFLRGIHLSLLGQIFRKGGQKDIYYAYIERENLPFLYSPKRIDYSLRFSFYYEILHNLYMNAGYAYAEISDEDLTRTPDFLIGKTHSINASFSYGLP